MVTIAFWRRVHCCITIPRVILVSCARRHIQKHMKKISCFNSSVPVRSRRLVRACFGDELHCIDAMARESRLSHCRDGLARVNTGYPAQCAMRHGMIAHFALCDRELRLEWPRRFYIAVKGSLCDALRRSWARSSRSLDHRCFDVRAFKRCSVSIQRHRDAHGRTPCCTAPGQALAVAPLGETSPGGPHF
jgi:hypothetical protein